MFIQSESTANENELRFVPGQAVLGQIKMVSYSSLGEAAGGSPLALALFEVSDDVRSVTLGNAHIDVVKATEADWVKLKPSVVAAIMDHFVNGLPVVLDTSEVEGIEEIDDIAQKVSDVIKERITPVVSKDGGEVIFHSVRDGEVVLELKGSAYAMMGGIENMIRHFVPEIERIVDYTDTLSKPGLETQIGIEVRRVLDEEVNPSVAMHGGHIALVDVQNDTAYIRLEGGCQGCGMADVTLKQGVEVAIKNAVPAIKAVLDSTDHGGGSNPYYQPGKVGMGSY